MRTFALSDIHGNNALFRTALKEVSIAKEDRLIIVGDVINKGGESKGVLDTIMQLRQRGFDVRCLLGNHEQLLLNAIDDPRALEAWFANGGAVTTKSFGVESIVDIPSEYIGLIRSFELIHETEDFVFAHAAVNMKIDDPYSDLKTILSERSPYEFLDESWLRNRKLIHGHTPTKQDQIEASIQNREKVICIDNGTYLDRPNYGSQCILQLETFEVRFVEKG